MPLRSATVQCAQAITVFGLGGDSMALENGLGISNDVELNDTGLLGTFEAGTFAGLAARS